MKIERTNVLNDLLSFSLRGSGIVVGRPGVGKTYLLAELHERMRSKGIPHLLLPVDQLGNGSEADLQAELSYEGDLVEKLRDEIERLEYKPGVLLFDGFDAARNEETRSRFLKLIRRSVFELKGLWNVVVTVRTYDAKKSHDLLNIFGSSFDTDFAAYREPGIPCRHFGIQPLTDEEIEQAITQIAGLETIRRAASQDFQKLLKVPFNLWLLENVLRETSDAPDLSQVRSTVQLLGLFWEHRVEFKTNREDREIILTQTLRKMVSDRSLSARKEDIYRPDFREAWNELMSDEVLVEASSTGQRVAFSHNILFDYAVSVLLIEDEPNALVAFISEDQSRPLFLHPSLTYYFTRLWYDEPDIFWKSFWRVLPDPSLHIRLFARLLPPSVLVNEARKVDDLDNLMTALTQGRPEASEAVLRVLQALRVSDVVRDELWSQILDRFSENIQKEFAWDLATLTSMIINRAANIPILEACGRISRRLLAWVWRQRQESNREWVDGLGAQWAVSLVAKTFGTNPQESRLLLDQVLGLTKEERFPIGYLYRLADEIENLWQFDAAFVAKIYLTVFDHIETSEEKTFFGTPIMPLTTTRRQDYDMCQYLLISRYPKFLRAAPVPATLTAITVLNLFILREHVVRYSPAGVTLESLIEEFPFRGKTARYIGDNSFIWDSGYEEEPIKLAGALFSFIYELSSSEEQLQLLDSILDLFAESVWVAFFWRKLLETGVRAPKVFAPRLFELCLARPIQIGGEALHELGEFLEAAWPEFTEGQMREIEQSILTISEGEGDEEKRLFVERRRERLLARIPEDRLITDEGRIVRQAMVEARRVPGNEPLASFTMSSRTYTEEDWLKERGVDPARPENQELKSYFAALGQFTSRWENKIPPPEEIKQALPVAQDARAALDRIEGVDKEVVESARTQLAACARLMSRGITDAESAVFQFCREVLLASALHELPLPDLDREADYSTPSWSPTPRTEAAQGLPWLGLRQPDEGIISAIDRLTNDPVPSIRFLVTGELFRIWFSAPEEFWRMAEGIAEREKNGVVLRYLFHSLKHVAARDEERTVKVLDKVAARSLAADESIELLDDFIPLVMWLVLKRGNAWASGVNDTLLANPVRWGRQLRRAAFNALTFLTPASVASAETNETAGRAVSWLMTAVDSVVGGVKELRAAAADGGWTEELQLKLKDVYGVIDEIVLRTFFAADVSPSLRDHGKEPVGDEQRRNYYFKIKPLLERVLKFASDKENGLLFASTAHHFMELLNGVLAYDPRGVLHMAAGVAESSESSNYNMDSMAIREVVKMVEAILVDHRAEVRDGAPLQDLLTLLDIFAKTGWPEALQLVWRLDEVFR